MMRKPKKFFIRELKTEDLNEVEKIEAQCFSCPWSKKAILESALSENNYFIVAEIEKEEIIAYAGIYCVGKEAYMYNIAVKAKHRGKGVGIAIMKQLFGYCNKKGMELLSLEVRESNYIAINLYKKLGFEILGQRKNFYKSPCENGLIMTKYFKKGDYQ